MGWSTTRGHSRAQFADEARDCKHIIAVTPEAEPLYSHLREWHESEVLSNATQSSRRRYARLPRSASARLRRRSPNCGGCRGHALHPLRQQARTAERALSGAEERVYTRVNATFPHMGSLERRVRHIWSSFLDRAVEFPQINEHPVTHSIILCRGGPTVPTFSRFVPSSCVAFSPTGLVPSNIRRGAKELSMSHSMRRWLFPLSAVQIWLHWTRR